MSSRLRNAGNIPLFDLGSCEPQKTTTRKQASRKRKTTCTTAAKRSTRSKSNVIPNHPQPETTTMTYRTRSKAANTELSEPEPKPTRDAVKTKQPAVRVTRATRSMAQSLAPSEPGVAVTASKAIKDKREPYIKPTGAVTNKSQPTGRTTRSARDKVDKLEGMNSVQRTTRSTRRKNKEPDVATNERRSSDQEGTAHRACCHSINTVHSTETLHCYNPNPNCRKTSLRPWNTFPDQKDICTTGPLSNSSGCG